MHNKYRTEDYQCDGCPWYEEVKRLGYLCVDLMFREPDLAIKIVQDWSDQHPKKTRLDVLLEQYPAVKNVERPFAVFCAGTMYGFGCEGNYSCEECWNALIEEGE